MRHLIETGVLFERDGRWTSALTPDEIGVPEGVKEVLGAGSRGSRRLPRVARRRRGARARVRLRGPAGDGRGRRGRADRRARGGAGAQLVVELEGAGPAYAFTHALVRETLYGELSAPAAAAHARARRGGDRARGRATRQVAALAVHHRLAGPAGDPAKAIDYSLRPAPARRELSAWEEAAAHWDGALAVMARAGGREAERARLLVALADLMVVGRRPRPPDRLPRAGARALRASSATTSAPRRSTRGSAWRTR